MEIPNLTVMTLNVYFGCDIGPVFAAGGLPELIDAVGELWSQMEASDIPARARVIAKEISVARPDLVGLQEVVQWSAGSAGAMSVKYDFLHLILEALRKEGSLYTPIAISNDLDQIAPLDTDGNFMRFKDRDAVLLKIGAPFSPVRPYDIQTRNFSMLFNIKNPLTGSMTIPRGWILVDAMIGDAKFRFISSHVESLDHTIQLAQTRELLAGPAQVALPLIVAGDFNSNANRQPDVEDYTATYPELVGAGFIDTWSTVNPGHTGNTCCHAADLRNSLSTLNRRIDLILTRGGLTPVNAKLVAANPAVRTSSGMWPTDHAGVSATLRFV